MPTIRVAAGPARRARDRGRRRRGRGRGEAFFRIRTARPRRTVFAAEGAGMFEVADHDRIVGACEVHGTGRFAGQVAIFLGPAARDGAEAYARWLNGGAAHQRRWSDPGSKGRADPGP